MFSTAQLEIIRSHVPQMREQGYLYYLAVDLRYNNGSVPDDVSLYIFYSNDPIVYNRDYEFDIPGDCVGYAFNTDSVSNYNNGPRMYNEFFLNGAANDVIDLVQEDYLFYSTNAIPGENASFYGATMVPVDFVYSEVKQNDTSSGLLFIACVFIFFYSFLKLFRR